MMKQIYDEIIDKFGSQSELARALGLTRQAVSVWRSRGVPLIRAIEIEQLCGIKAESIRPDIFCNHKRKTT